MRCPHCKFVFQVTHQQSTTEREAIVESVVPDAPKNSQPRTDPPSPQYRSGNLADFVQIVHSESTKPNIPTTSKKSSNVESPEKKNAASLTASEPIGAPKEVLWSPDLDVPTINERPAVLEVDQKSEPIRPPSEALLILPSTTKRKRRRRMLVGLILFTVFGMTTGGIFFKLYLAFAPERLYNAAKKEYEESHFDQARKLYERIANEHPSHERATEARFFAPLSGLRNSVSSVMNKSDPKLAISQWDDFQSLLSEPSIGQFAEKSRFGIDVWQAGTKLVEDILSKGHEVFNRDDFSESTKWLQEATRIESTLEKYRPDDAGKSENISRELASLSRKIADAEVRASVLAELRQILTEPTDLRLSEARQLATSRGLDKDDGYLKIQSEAEQKIRSRASYLPLNPTISAITPPDDGTTSLLFAPRLDRGPRVPVRGSQTTFLAEARGILYALDETDGHVLWAMRTGIDCQVPATKLQASDASPELALVPTLLNGQAGLHARHIRNGLSIWYQPLPAAIASPPVQLGADIYVPLADDLGTILEIVGATGELRGKIVLGRPIGGPIVIRPGTGQLFIPAESASVYVFDVDRRGGNNEHLDPSLVGVISTGHRSASIQGTPFFANPEPDQPGTRHYLICTSNSLDQMSLRACPFLDGESGTIESSSPPTEMLVPGWSRFPVYCDGEQIALATDQQELLRFGMKLSGNRDLMLFPLPGNKDITSTEKSTAQIVQANEVNFWAVLGKSLHLYRSGFTDRDGIKLLPVGKPLFLGEPTQSAQVNSSREMMVTVTQEGGSFRATAISSQTAQILWQRELGLLVKGNPQRKGDDLFWLDHGGGISVVDAKQLTQDRGATWLVDERWLLAAPTIGYRPMTELLRGPNETFFVLLESTNPQERRLLIRIVDGRKPVEEKVIPVNGMLAGEPIVVGKHLVVPLDNGTLYRVAVLEGKSFEEGPTWRGNQLPKTSKCYLQAINEEDFLASDGNKSIARFKWLAKNKRFESAGKITLKEKLRSPMFVLSGTPTRLFTSDQFGNLAMWNADTMSPTSIRGWRASGKDPVLPSNELLVSIYPLDSGAEPPIVVLGNRSAFALKLDQEKPIWKLEQPVTQQSSIYQENTKALLLTNRTGNVRRLNLETGEMLPNILQITGSLAVAGAAIPVEGKHFFVPLSDGSVLFAEQLPLAKPLAPGKP